jgi:hypothetical protein
MHRVDLLFMTHSALAGIPIGDACYSGSLGVLMATIPSVTPVTQIRHIPFACSMHLASLFPVPASAS